jgi:ribosomal protein S18 acetylase RimI-like enzyme
VLLAFVDGVPAGLVIGFEGFSTFACKPLLNVHDVFVAARFRGRGLAGRMLARVEEIAKQRGCCKLTLEVLEGNAVAQSVYRKFGFSGYQLDPQLGKALFWEKKL